MVADEHVVPPPPPPPPPPPIGPPASARSSSSEPLNRSTSIPPLIPGTLLVSLYCQNAQVSQGDVRSGHSVVYWAIHSGLTANDVGPPTSSRQKNLPV